MLENLLGTIQEETYKAEAETEKVKIDHVVIQYRALAAAIELFWNEVGIRTNNAEWRLDGPRKGVGSCMSVDYNWAWMYIDGAPRIELLKQRDWRNQLTGGEQKYCPFFRVNQGCVLGNLKSPLCLGHIEPDHGREIKEKFGIKIPEIQTPFKKIQLGGINQEEKDYTLRPELNDQFVIETIEQWGNLIEHVREFPVLHPDIIINYDQILSLEPVSEPIREKRFIRRRVAFPVG